MTTLQKEILQAIADNSATYPDPEAVKAAAEVCLRWLEEAFEAGRQYEKDSVWMPVPKQYLCNFAQFLKDNGLTE